MAPTVLGVASASLGVLWWHGHISNIAEGSALGWYLECNHRPRTNPHYFVIPQGHTHACSVTSLAVAQLPHMTMRDAGVTGSALEGAQSSMIYYDFLWLRRWCGGMPSFLLETISLCFWRLGGTWSFHGLLAMKTICYGIALSISKNMESSPVLLVISFMNMKFISRQNYILKTAA